jgi:hypothetical protein
VRYVFDASVGSCCYVVFSQNNRRVVTTLLNSPVENRTSTLELKSSAPTKSLVNSDIAISSNSSSEKFHGNRSSEKFSNSR